MSKKFKSLNHLIKRKYRYQLLENGFTALDINKGKEVLNSRRITMANYTRNFELSFAKKIGVKYALMVNSGSSANLLATFAAGNPLKKKVFLVGKCAILTIIISCHLEKVYITK